MKRSDALAPLSREHHVALAVALELRRATEEGLPRAIARFAAFWREAGAHHFHVEEETLLTALPTGDPEWDAACARVREEHRDIIARAAALAGGGVEPARALGEALTAHVRFEERVLFSMLERELDGERLRALGTAVVAA
jgi:hypothetical protein